jgi:hypothetical protein
MNRRPGGIVILDKRKKVLRPCLNCGRAFATVINVRICGYCKKRRTREDPGPDLRAIAIPGIHWR